MNIFFSIAAILLSLIVIIRFLVVSKDKMQFFAQGFDNGLKARELRALWKLAKQSGLEEPLDLFVSTATVNRCIGQIIKQAKENGTENSYATQSLLEDLYKFKTRIALDKDNRRGLESSKFLDKDQRLSIILKGYGVFTSKILNNSHELTISVPLKKNKQSGFFQMILKPEEWEGKEISVYFWRKGDAGYAFDTTVLSSGMFISTPALFLKHSNNLDRTQQRQSVRIQCSIYAQMYLLDGGEIDYDYVETVPGYNCLLEDISEDGAMIRIGGPGKKDAKIKIQYNLNDALVIMFGEIKAVEFNPKLNQSRLHFECKYINPSMKNTVLTYIYNVIPEEQKDIHEALSQIQMEETELQKIEHSDISDYSAKPEQKETQTEQPLNINISDSTDESTIMDLEEL